MSMTSSNTKGTVSEINVTPLIDVLLVLLIIFMVIVPITPKGLDALLPQPSRPTAVPQGPSDPIVVQVASNGEGAPSHTINQQSFAKDQLEGELALIFSTRAEKVMFVKGDKDLSFARISEVVDYGHQAGIDNIGILTQHMNSLQ